MIGTCNAGYQDDNLTVSLLLNASNVFIVQLEEHGDGRGLDGDTTLLFILTSVGVPHVASLGSGNDTSHTDERVGQGRLPVIN